VVFSLGRKYMFSHFALKGGGDRIKPASDATNMRKRRQGMFHISANSSKVSCIIGAILLLAGFGSGAGATDLEAVSKNTNKTITMTDLGSLGDGFDGAEATGINNKGQVVGRSITSHYDEHAFIWENGVMTDLGTLGGAYSIATGINDKEEVVGWSTITPVDPDYPDFSFSYDDLHAFIWKDGVITDLGTLGGSASGATGINDKGEVVGWSDTTVKYESRPFIWKDGVMTDLGTLGGPRGGARGINNKGEVVGDSVTSLGEYHAFIWKDGVMTDLGTLGGGTSIAYGINNKGQVLGYSTYDKGSSSRGSFFIWQSGTMIPIEIGVVGSNFPNYDAANSINNKGEVVGVFVTEPGYGGKGYIFQNGEYSFLAATIDGKEYWTSANCINERGQVVGSASFYFGSELPIDRRAILWSIK
jgi:probable HAF family extracellular repeat protein